MVYQEHFQKILDGFKTYARISWAKHKWDKKSNPFRCSECGAYWSQAKEDERSCKRRLMDEALR